MERTELINNLEKISSKIPNRILKIHGYIFKEDKKEKLEIIIFKGFSSSTTHPIEIELEKKVIEMDYIFTNFELYIAPLNPEFDHYIRESKDSLFFLNEENWA